MYGFSCRIIDTVCEELHVFRLNLFDYTVIERTLTIFQAA